MKLEEFERLAGRLETDGKASSNAETIMALVDAFLLLPCAADEMDAAARLRAEWVVVRQQGPDWTKWKTQDLLRLLSMLVLLGELMGRSAEWLEIYVLARRLQEG